MPKTIPKVVIISLLHFKLFNCAGYFSEFRMMEKARHEELTDKLSIRFFELPKIPKENEASGGILSWLEFFKAETEEYLDSVASNGGEEMLQAVEQVRSLSNSMELAFASANLERARLDEGQRISNAVERGRTEGITIGRTEGLTAGRAEIIDLLMHGASREDILAKYGR